MSSASDSRPNEADRGAVRVRVTHVGSVRVPLPEYQTRGAAGMDLRAAVAEPVTIPPGERRFVTTGLAIAIPDGYEGQVRPRSGLALRHGIGIVNAPGTIDADYRGEIGIVLVNHGAEPFVVEPLARIAQLVIAPVARAELEVVPSLDETERGAGGYGSTGGS
ncbi:MAG TPA: dUTP diphosphatase [Polyangiaceae bacterium]|nr:dUTP diphosphatase [Polyangiaceae bacterium]